MMCFIDFILFFCLLFLFVFEFSLKMQQNSSVGTANAEATVPSQSVSELPDISTEEEIAMMD